tara:strand:- start:1 stop:1728 length:1728 start_codon:yes stop_codon:yes gene_type:complete
MAERQYKVYPDDVGSITAVDSTWRDAIRNILAESLGGERNNYRQAENLLSVGDFLPAVGGGLMSADVADAYEAGNYKTAGMLATLGMIPVAGPTMARGGKGLLTSAGNLVNRVVQNVPTHIEEFYRNPIKGAINFTKEYGKAVAPAIKESIDPSAVAQRRVLGISDRKIDDWASDVGKDADLTAISISRQLPNTENTLLENSIVALKYLDSRIPKEDTARLATGIGNGFRTTGEIPESIVNRALRHLTEGPHIKNPKTSYEYQIKDPSSGKNIGYLETTGVAKAGSSAVRAMRGKSTDTYLELVNNLRKSTGGKPKAKLDSQGMVEYLQIASTLDGNAFQAMKKLGAGDQPSVMLDTLLRARAKQNAGRNLGKGEKKVLDSFNNLLDTKVIKMGRVTDEAGNVVSNRNLTEIKQPEGYLVTQQSYSSRQQELGGVNSFLVVDPNKEKMYTMLSDGHDMFGLNPVGGTGLITVSPIIESSYRTGSKYNNKQIKTSATKRKTNKAIKNTEQQTGIKKEKNETNENYTKRAFRLSKPPVTEADKARATAAKRKLQGTAGGAGLLATAGVVSSLEGEEE